VWCVLCSVYLCFLLWEYVLGFEWVVLVRVFSVCDPGCGVRFYVFCGGL